MREVIHRVNAPLAPGMMMFGVANSIKHGVAHPHLRRGHIYFGAQRALSIRELARFHPGEQVQILLGAAASKGALLASPVRGASVLVSVFSGKIIDVSQ